jgi:hypothetical protein
MKSARSGERQNGVKALSEFSGLSFRVCPIGYFPNHQGLDFQIGPASLLWQDEFKTGMLSPASECRATEAIRWVTRPLPLALAIAKGDKDAGPRARGPGKDRTLAETLSIRLGSLKGSLEAFHPLVPRTQRLEIETLLD